jgi:hypothetical protein
MPALRNRSFRLAKRHFRCRWVFRFGSGPIQNEAAAFDWRAPCECASGLKPCSQKLRKSALKPLKSLVRVNLCARRNASPTARERRSLQSPPRFAPLVEFRIRDRPRSPPGYAEPLTARNRRANLRRPISSSIIICGSEREPDTHRRQQACEFASSGRCDRRKTCATGSRANRIRLSLDFRSLVWTAGVEPAQSLAEGRPAKLNDFDRPALSPDTSPQGPERPRLQRLTGRGISKRRANRAASVVLGRSKRRRDFGPLA